MIRESMSGSPRFTRCCAAPGSRTWLRFRSLGPPVDDHGVNATVFGEYSPASPGEPVGRRSGPTRPCRRIRRPRPIRRLGCGGCGLRAGRGRSGPARQVCQWHPGPVAIARRPNGVRRPDGLRVGGRGGRQVLAGQGGACAGLASGAGHYGEHLEPTSSAADGWAPPLIIQVVDCQPPDLGGGEPVPL